jgi:hypothetical protein
MTMDTPHDAPAHHGGLIFIEPAATAPVTADGCATLQTAFAALLRPRVATGRPAAPPRRHGPPPLRAPGPGETPGPLDPADPGLDDRVRAILGLPTRTDAPDERRPIA